MTLYKIVVRATTDGFDVKVDETDAQIFGELVCWTSGDTEGSLPMMQLNKHLTGRLYAYEPEITMYTCKDSNIDACIDSMKSTILNYLYQRLEFIDRMIDVCK